MYNCHGCGKSGLDHDSLSRHIARSTNRQCHASIDQATTLAREQLRARLDTLLAPDNAPEPGSGLLDAGPAPHRRRMSHTESTLPDTPSETSSASPSPSSSSHSSNSTSSTHSWDYEWDYPQLQQPAGVNPGDVPMEIDEEPGIPQGHPHDVRFREPVVIRYPGQAGRAVCTRNDPDAPKAPFSLYEDELVSLSERNPYAPFASKMEWEIARWAKMRGPSATAFNEFLAIEGV